MLLLIQFGHDGDEIAARLEQFLLGLKVEAHDALRYWLALEV